MPTPLRRTAGGMPEPGKRTLGLCAPALRPRARDLDGRVLAGMFVRDEIVVALPLGVAVARLANLRSSGIFSAASGTAWDTGVAQISVGPSPLISRLVAVRFGELAARADSAHLAFRWEVSGPGASLFPALDADITLTAAGPERTLLKLDGAYRPPLGSLGAGLDRALLHHVAAVTIRAFLSRISAVITDPAVAASTNRTAPQPGKRPAPETD